MSAAEWALNLLLVLPLLLLLVALDCLLCLCREETPSGDREETDGGTANESMYIPRPSIEINLQKVSSASPPLDRHTPCSAKSPPLGAACRTASFKQIPIANGLLLMLHLSSILRCTLRTRAVKLESSRSSNCHSKPPSKDENKALYSPAANAAAFCCG